MTETKRSVGWSILPSDVLDIILDNLFHVSDYVRFGAVCKSWKSVAVNYQKQKRIAAVHDQPPMLLFIGAADYSRHTGLFNLGSRSILFSIGEERLYENGFRFDQWITNHKVICLGSSYGWLAMEQSTSKIMLINPFSRKVIEIPRVPFRSTFKIVMSCDPSKHPDELVIAALAGNGRVALITLGQQRWTIVDEIYCRTENNRGDIIFHNWLLYVVDTYSSIYVIDYKHSQTYDRKVPKVRCRSYNFDQYDCCRESFDYVCHSRYFLVEAGNGDLVLVLCSLPSYLGNPNWKFNVFKVDFFMEEEKDHWEGIEMVRSGDAIFLSDNSCLCIPATNSGTNPNPNSIYFSFNFRDKRYPEHFRFWERQTGVYNLEDGTLKDLSGLSDQMVPVALLSPCIGEARVEKDEDFARNCSKCNQNGHCTSDCAEWKKELQKRIGKDKEEIEKDEEGWIEVKRRCKSKPEGWMKKRELHERIKKDIDKMDELVFMEMGYEETIVIGLWIMKKKLRKRIKKNMKELEELEKELQERIQKDNDELEEMETSSDEEDGWLDCLE